jgi:crotonobetainyl-CoA:carnitine CoA-transferase CaiB-like acyl-CoA transferase
VAIEVLGDIRVVDLSSGVAGAYVTKLFADAGADVVLVEPPGGSPLRRLTRHGALPEGSPDSPLFRWLCAGKRSVGGRLGDESVARLVEAADLVVEDLPAGTLEAAGVLPDPANVVVSITPYGRGPMQDLPANDFTAQAMAGSIAARGRPELEPIHASGRLSEMMAGVFAAPAALAAVRRLRVDGIGVHPIPGRMLMVPGIEATADGWIGLNTNARQKLDDLLALVGRDDLIQVTDLRSDPEVKADFERSIVEWLQARPLDEVLELAMALRIPAAPVTNGETVQQVDHFVERGVFVDEPYGLTAPRPHYTLDGVRAGVTRPAPTIDAQVAAAEVAADWPTPAGRNRGGSRSRLPLEGVKVVDTTVWWAGPSATQLFAALGADVIHVESIQAIDGMRPAAAQPFAAMDEWWERSSFFLGINPNKRDLTLDLGSERGRELLMGLVEWGDVMVENLAPRVMDGWGITWEHLHAVNPRLIMCRMPAFGLDGPWRDLVGFAQTMEQVSGLSWATGYRGGAPIMPNGPCDPAGGMHAAFALLVALQRREETGEGSIIESPLVESALNLAAEELLEFSAYGRVGERLGNRSRERAPQGVYRCEGDEQWVALSVDDDRWPALVELLGSPAWASAPGLATTAGRFAAHDEIDAELARWFAGQDRDDAWRRLVGHGIAAAPVVDHRDVSTFELFTARGFPEVADHPVAGAIPVPGMPYRWSGIDRWIRTPSPTLGQHNHEVLAEVLGLDADEISRLEDDEIIGTRPLGL